MTGQLFLHARDFLPQEDAGGEPAHGRAQHHDDDLAHQRRPHLAQGRRQHQHAIGPGLFGGMDLLDSTLNTNFGVEIAGNVEVDFGEFQTLIDSIGGIDLELTQDEADYICGRKRDVTYPQQLRTDWNLHEGVNHLTGEQALIHARNRSLGNDYARTDRQRAVLMAIINKVKQMDAVSIVNFINQVLPLLTTDMTSGEILGYAMEALQMNFDSEHSYRIPAEGTYTGAVIRGMQVLVPDLAANQTYLMDVLYHTDNNQ